MNTNLLEIEMKKEINSVHHSDGNNSNTETKHDEFWKRTSENAVSRIKKLFEDSNIPMKEIIGGDGEIRNYVDAKKALAFVLCHAETNNEKACAILSACEWLHSCNELHEAYG